MNFNTVAVYRVCLTCGFCDHFCKTYGLLTQFVLTLMLLCPTRGAVCGPVKGFLRPG